MEKIKLSKPIEAEGKTITELEIGEPLWGDISDAIDRAGGQGGMLMSVLMSNLAKVPVSSIRQLCAKDVGVITRFLSPSLKDFAEVGGVL